MLAGGVCGHDRYSGGRKHRKFKAFFGAGESDVAPQCQPLLAVQPGGVTGGKPRAASTRAEARLKSKLR
jgi:hypothetical protein